MYSILCGTNTKIKCIVSLNVFNTTKTTKVAVVIHFFLLITPISMRQY